MKILLMVSVTFLYVMFAKNTHAQTLLQWQYSYGDSGFEQPFGSEPTMDGGIILGGHSNSVPTGFGDITSNYGNYDWWLLKLDSMGHKEWSKSYGGSAYDKCRNASENSDGTIIAFGSVQSNDSDVSGSHGGNDFWLLKTDSAGNKLWSRCYGGTSDEGGRTAIETNDSNYLIAGYTRSSNGDMTANYGSFDVWLAKVTPDSGNIIWQKNYGGSLDERVRSIHEWPNGDFVFTGNASSIDHDLTGTTNHGGEDIWTARVDANGNFMWSSQLGGPGFDRAYYCTRDLDGNVLVAGRDSGNGGDITNNHGGSDCWVIKLDFNTGALIWQKSFGGTEDDEGFRIDPEPGGGYMIGATTESTDDDSPGVRGLSDFWLIRTDSNLNIIWTRTDGGGSWDHLNDVVRMNDGGWVGVGFSSSKPGAKSEVTVNHGLFDLWVCKIIFCDSLPIITYTGSDTICGNTPVILSTTNNYQSYLWSTGETTQSISVDTSGSYFLTITSANLGGCQLQADTVKLTFFPAPSIPVISAAGGVLSSSTAYAYQWYVNSNPILGAQADTLVLTQAGVFYVITTDSNGCTAQSASVSNVGIADQNATVNFNIYPNPVKDGWLQLTGYSMQAKHVSMKIIDMHGKLILDNKLKTSPGKNNFRVNISTLSKGFYTLQLSDENGVFLNQKLVIE
ncbi:MAG: T9SS type A sorting domain-containing protein [Bacteroidia bacterium]